MVENLAAFEAPHEDEGRFGAGERAAGDAGPAGRACKALPFWRIFAEDMEERPPRLTRELLDAGKLEVTLRRLCCEVVERRLGLAEICVLGVQPRGVFPARRVRDLLAEMLPETDIRYGELDVTFHRDDFRRQEKPLAPNATNIPFSLEDRYVLLVDDVLFTGRTARAALDALLSFGRPTQVELLALVDRLRRRELPVEADYVGLKVESIAEERVVVEWAEARGRDSVRIQSGP